METRCYHQGNHRCLKWKTSPPTWEKNFAKSVGKVILAHVALLCDHDAVVQELLVEPRRRLELRAPGVTHGRAILYPSIHHILTTKKSPAARDT